MREFAFTVTEHDPERPWLVLGQEQRTVELEDGASFFEWAHAEWAAPRYSVELAPWGLSRGDQI